MKRWHALFALAGVTSGVAGAQTPRVADQVIRVVVADSAGRPVSGAEVSVVRGLHEVLAHGTTDDAGKSTLTVPHGGPSYQVSVRKIGFVPSDRFISLPDTASGVDFHVVLLRAVQRIEAVRVTAEENLRRKSYHVEADDISNSSRPILDGYDILTKLRPDMLYSRAGPNSDPPCIIHDVWVNGRRVVLPVISDMDRARHVRTSKVPIGVEATLHSIKPEHVAEIDYADCFDNSVAVVGGQNAAFVILKPGVSFEPGIGSFIAEVAAAPLASQLPPVPPAQASAYRRRLLGVYDIESGEPIEGAQVVDQVSGTFMSTTATGTVSLLFIPDGTWELRIHKPGYKDLTFEVSISPRDTVPLTMVLSKIK